jgi:NAD(P) transhydrogenase subunit alpha
LGSEIIARAPPFLVPPLLSGAAVIGGVTIVGAIIVAGGAPTRSTMILGTLAVALATVHVLGGFLATLRASSTWD